MKRTILFLAIIVGLLQSCEVVYAQVGGTFYDYIRLSSITRQPTLQSGKGVFWYDKTSGHLYWITATNIFQLDRSGSDSSGGVSTSTSYTWTAVQTFAGISYKMTSFRYDSTIGVIQRDSIGRAFRIFTDWKRLVNAVNAFDVNTRGQIDLAPDSILINTTTTLPRGRVKISGYSTKLYTSTLNGPLLYIPSTCSDVEIEGIGMRGTRDSTKTLEVGILVDGASNVTIHHTYIKDFTKAGIEYDNYALYPHVYANTLDRIYANGTMPGTGGTFRQGVGIFCFKGIMYGKFHDNWHINDGTRGIAFDDASTSDTASAAACMYNDVYSNHYKGIIGYFNGSLNGIAMYAEGSSYNNFHDNDDVDSCSIGWLANNGQSYRRSLGNKVLTNVFSRMLNYGIGQANASSTTIIGNTVEYSARAMLFDFQLYTRSIPPGSFTLDTARVESTIVQGNILRKNTVGYYLRDVGLTNAFYGDYLYGNGTDKIIANSATSTIKPIFYIEYGDSLKIGATISAKKMVLMAPNASSEIIGGASKVLNLVDTTVGSTTSPDIVFTDGRGARIIMRKSGAAWQIVNNVGLVVGQIGDSTLNTFSLKPMIVGGNSSIAATGSNLTVAGQADIRAASAGGTAYLNFDSLGAVKWLAGKNGSQEFVIGNATVGAPFRIQTDGNILINGYKATRDTVLAFGTGTRTAFYIPGITSSAHVVVSWAQQNSHNGVLSAIAKTDSIVAFSDFPETISGILLNASYKP